MNALKLFSEVLAQELTAESISKLNALWVLINGGKNNRQYSELSDALLEDKMIYFIFQYAKNQQTGKKDSIILDYMNRREVMEVLGISKRTLAKWCASGTLSFTVYRNKYYYRVEDLIKLFEINYFLVASWHTSQYAHNQPDNKG